MKAREVESARLSKKVVIRPGDKIRARGGPVYKGKRIGDPGIYEVRRVFTKRDRVFAECARLDKVSSKSDVRLASGIFTLFISGKPYRSRVVESIINRPYRVSKVRS